jgi:hypothetical protein
LKPADGNGARCHPPAIDERQEKAADGHDARRHPPTVDER